MLNEISNDGGSCGIFIMVTANNKVEIRTTSGMTINQQAKDSVAKLLKDAQKN